MWEKSYTTVTKKVSASQMWRLFSDVNHWHLWDESIDFAQLHGEFIKGNFFVMKIKNGPKVRIELIQTQIDRSFTDLTRFPLARMTGEHRFEETAEGLRITTTMRVTGILGFLWRRIVAQGIVDGLPSDVARQIEFASQL
jgi:hypothetical protein